MRFWPNLRNWMCALTMTPTNGWVREEGSKAKRVARNEMESGYKEGASKLNLTSFKQFSVLNMHIVCR